jgi:hypothetical protein
MQTDIEAALIGINHLAERLGLSRRTSEGVGGRQAASALTCGLKAYTAQSN